MGSMQFPKLTLRQAGERLKRIVAGNPGPKDHLRVAEACVTANSLEEALARVAGQTEFQVDVDDAASYIRKGLNGELPFSEFEMEALTVPDAQSNSDQANKPKGASLGM